MAESSKKKDKVNSVAGQIAGVLLNPGKQIKQFTRITRFQAEVFPLFDTIIKGRQHIIEIAFYNENPKAYKTAMRKIDPEHPGIPVVPDLADTYLTSIAEWQRSISGDDNFTKITSDLAVEDIRASSNNGKDGLGDFGDDDEY